MSFKIAWQRFIEDENDWHEQIAAHQKIAHDESMKVEKRDKLQELIILIGWLGMRQSRSFYLLKLIALLMLINTIFTGLILANFYKF